MSLGENNNGKERGGFPSFAERPGPGRIVGLDSGFFHPLFGAHSATMLLIEPGTGQIVDANAAAERFYGWPLPVLRSMKIQEINTLPADEVQRQLDAANQGKRQYFEFVHRRADGSLRDVEVHASKVAVSKGQELLYSIIHDVTERKSAQKQLRAAKVKLARESELRQSEENFRTLINTVTDMFVVSTLDGHVLFTNRAFDERLGYSREELERIHLLDIHPRDVRVEAESIFGDMLQGTRQLCTLPVMARNGTLVPVETRVWMGKWSGRDVIFGILKDLTEAEAARQLFEKLFLRNPSPMALVDVLTGKFVEVNEAFTRSLGYARDDVVGRVTGDVGLAKDPVIDQRISEQLNQSGVVEEFEVTLLAKDGREIVGLLFADRIVSQGKKYSLVVMVDITERRAAEERVRLERARLAQIIEGTNVGTWEWNVQSGECDFNEKWASICGYTLDELSPTSIQTWLDLAHPDDLAESGELLRRHFSGETDFYDLEARMRHKDGRWVWVHDRGKVARWSEDGQPLIMAGTHQDVTRRRENEEELRHSVAFEELLAATSSALFRSSEEELDTLLGEVLRMFGEFVQVDRSYIFRYDTSRETMSNTHEWCAPGIPPEIDNLKDVPLAAFPEWMATLRRGEMIYVPDVSKLPDSWSAEREILEPQGVRSLLVLPLLSGSRDMGFIGFDSVRIPREWGNEERSLLRFLSDNVGSTIDRVQKTSELRVATQEARELATQADHANRTKSLFLARMSHEIRTPMNAVLGFAQILERDATLSKDQKLNVRTIIRSGEHLLSLINDILDMSKIEAGKMELRPEPFNLHDLVADVDSTFKARAATKGLDFNVRLDPSVPPLVVGDESKVRQILFNLLGNSLKFTEQGRVSLIAHAESDAEDSDCVWLYVSVEDTGPGIPESQRAGLFEPFQQAEAGVRSGGTGLGLAISNKFVQMMGGRLAVSTIPGSGSCFEFTVSLTRATQALGGGHETQRHAVGLRGSPEVQVLVVDDVRDNRMVLEKLLVPLGFSVECAGDGAEALSKVERHRPDIVLMDVRMPVMDGLEATRRLKARDEWKSVPVVAVTASAFEEDESRIRLSGVDAYVRKPFRPGELLETIGRLLSLEYDYEQPNKKASSAPRESIAEEVEALPVSERSVLIRLIQEGDITQFNARLESLSGQVGMPLVRLREMAERYQYRELIRRLSPSQEDAKEPS